MDNVDSSCLVDYVDHFALMIQWVNDVLSITESSINSVQDISNGLNTVNFMEQISRMHISSAKREDLNVYDKYYNMELCLELCRSLEIPTDNITSQDLIEKNIPKTLLFLTRLAIYSNSSKPKKNKIKEKHWIKEKQFQKT